MTQQSYPWATGKDDGSPYSADYLRWPTKALLGEPSANQGIFRGQFNEAAVTSPGNNQIRIATGRAHVNGTLWREEDAAIDVASASPTAGTTGRLVVLRKFWATGTVRVAIKSSADGTATIPSPTQIDGDTWEIPLASFTITTGGVIGSLTDLRAYLTPLAGWVTLDARTLGSAASSISFQSISSIYRLFRLSLYLIKDGSSGTVNVRLNNDSGSNYTHQRSLVSGTSYTGAGSATQAQFRPVTADLGANAVMYGELSIAKPVASQLSRMVWAGGFASGLIHAAGAWDNTADLINRIDIISGTADFAAGSRVVLEGFAI